MPHLHLVVPGLWPQSIAALPAAQKKQCLKGLWFPSLSRFGDCQGLTWPQLLSELSGHPKANLCAGIYWLGETSMPAPAWLCRADPLYLRTAGGGLIAIPPDDGEPSPETTRILVSALNDCLANSPFAITSPVANRWYLYSTNTLELPEVPTTEALIGQFIDTGSFRDSRYAAVQQLRTEMEMCLFNLPWNREREQADKATVNSIWLWGGSCRVVPSPVSRHFRVYANDVLIRGCACAGQQSLYVLPERLDPTVLSQFGTEQDILIHVDSKLQKTRSSAHWRQQVEGLELNWIGPAWRALRAGQISELSLIDPGRLLLHCHHRQCRSWWRYWRVGTHLEATGC